jgi:hypothetical protein
MKGNRREKRSSFSIGSVGGTFIGVVVVIDVPISGRYLLDMIFSGSQSSPIAVTILTTWEEAAETDYGNVVFIRSGIISSKRCHERILTVLI